jgi:hypothetical protein
MGLVVSVVLLCAARGQAVAAELVIATGPAGGTFEVVAAAAMEILKKKAPDFRVSIIPGGSSGNVAVLGTGKANVSMITSDSAYAGWNGLPPFKQKYQSMRGMFVLYPNTLQVWATVKSGINDFPDLKGKKFTFGQPGSGPYPVGHEMLKLFGMTKEDGTLIALAWGQATDMLRDGNVDAVLWTTSFPAPAMVDAGTTGRIKLIQLNWAKLAEYAKKYPAWTEVTIPAGTYKNQEKDVKTIGSPVFFAVDKAMPDDQIYQVTKALYENRADLGNTHVLLKYIGKETVARGMGIPLHPGAEKYYREAGIVK